MKNKSFLFVIEFFFFNTVSFSQTTISSGSKYSIQSSVFEREREIQVYTPEGYDQDQKSYPVLSVLDGQRWYLQAVSYQRLFQEYGYTPDFIIVGINTDDQGRYGFFNNTENSSNF